MRAAFAAVLLAARAYGATACPGLATADAALLLALPGENPFASDWLPPAVRCATEDGGPGPGFCRWTTTIVRDAAIEAGRRLVVARAVAANGPGWDYVFVFGCVDGRVRAVLRARFDPGVVVETTRARVVLTGSDRAYAPERRRWTYAWSEDRQAYTESGAGPRLRRRIGAPRCDDVAAVALDDLQLVTRDGFALDHGMGCYSEIPEIDPANCGWFLTLDVDRMIGPNRRLLVVGRDHRGGVGWDGDVFVVGCRSGRVATLLAETWDRGATVPDATADTVTVAAGGWNPGDGACCLSREDRFGYAWDERLRSYVLRTVTSRSRTGRP